MISHVVGCAMSLTLLFTMFSGCVRGEGAPPLIGGLPGRAAATTSLDGRWMYICDPYDQGRIDFLSRPRSDGFWQDRHPRDERERVEYVFDDSHTLEVPGDWNTQDEQFFFYEGPMWYRRSFSYAPDPARTRAFLCFGGAATVADVWVNGTKVGGTHEVGFTPFHIEITDTVREGDNTVVVRVDNTRRADQVPALITDWWNYGGLTRSVSLVRTAGTFVRDAHVELSRTRPVVNGWVQLDGVGMAKAAVQVTLEHAGTIQVITDERGIARFEMDARRVPRWSPTSPVLCKFDVQAGDAAFSDRVGLRTIETRDGDLLLNGERVFLKGICIHEEALSHRGRAAGEADARELLGLARELGCNYVRLAHYPHDESMLRVADELGLMVWAEIPVYWEMEYTNPRTLELAKTHLREMIGRDHGRASVIIWSIGNETGEDADKTAFRTALGRYVKELDGSRLVSAALFARQERDSQGRLRRMIVDDPFGEVADVLAINQYVGWYHDQPESIRDVEVELAWNKPFLISETGAGVRAGRHGSEDAVWSEAFGVRYYREQLGWALGLEVCDGISPWILKDFLSPRRPLYGVQDWYNRKGLVSETGERKQVFFEVQRRYEACDR
ncbi:MAG: hypothetical protein KDA21_01955 [Phycisphaerales bacterium]|nr:hypothetical protein [Phycisphaerales bacterium]